MTQTTTTGPVCLIRPPAVETFRFSSLSITPPLGLAYVAGALEAAGHEVKVVDAVTGRPTSTPATSAATREGSRAYPRTL